jgi:Tol biopolymer transport system component
MPASVGTFAFTLYVSAPVVPAIVFEMWPGGNRDIYRMGIDGNDVTKLSTSVLTDAYPTVSQGTVVFTSYRDGNAELYSVPLKGGTETRLTSTTGTNETNASLSPDGTKLAWTAGAPGAITKVYYGTTATPGSYATAVAAGTRADPASSDAIESSPSWASSSRLSWTSSAGGTADIYNVTMGGSPGLLTGSSYADVEAAWSPDGKKLVFASNRSGDTELYLYDTSNASVTRLTTRAGSDGAPTWLADGRIVWTCVTGSAFHLCIMDPATPAGYSQITTPYSADHAFGVRF